MLDTRRYHTEPRRPAEDRPYAYGRDLSTRVPDVTHAYAQGVGVDPETVARERATAVRVARQEAKEGKKYITLALYVTERRKTGDVLFGENFRFDPDGDLVAYSWGELAR